MPSLQSRLMWPGLILLRAAQKRLARKGVGAVAKFSARTAKMDSKKKIYKGIRREKGVVGGVNGVWLHPNLKSSEQVVIMFVHGGGIFFGLASPQLGVGAKIALQTGLSLFAVDYRLMPQNTYPAAHDDVAAAYEALAAKNSIVLIGESSGGVLSLAAIMRAHKANKPLPVLWVGISPTCDYAFGSQEDFFDSTDPFNAPEFSALMVREYLHGADVTTPDLSPIDSQWNSMPPIILHWAEHDVLDKHAQRIKIAAERMNISCSSHQWKGMWHGWHLMPVPEAQECLKEISSQIKEHLNFSLPAR